MAHKIFANYSKSENKEKHHQISEKKDTFNFGQPPLALCRCLGNSTINRLIEFQGNVENTQQNDLDMQGINPGENYSNMLTAFRKQYGISAPNDPVEREAESVAKQIVNMKAPDSGQSQGVIDNDSNVWKTPKISRQHQASQNAQNNVNLDLPKSDGQPLERSVSEYMEPRFGHSFQDVRIHTSSQSADISHALNARAFATGRDIYFSNGEYNPQSNEGKRLIAHELTHVVQQGHAGQINNNLISRAKLPKKTVTVNFTKLHGATGSATSALTYANTKVYNQANTKIKKGNEVTLNEPQSKAILGPDLKLDEYTDPKKPTSEEKKLFKENQTAGVVTMYFVKASTLGSLGEAQWPALPTGLVGFVVNNIGTDNTFSHELGHVLLDSGTHAVPDATYLMHATAPDPKKLTPRQIKKIRVSPYAK